MEWLALVAILILGVAIWKSDKNDKNLVEMTEDQLKKMYGPNKNNRQ